MLRCVLFIPPAQETLPSIAGASRNKAVCKPDLISEMQTDVNSNLIELNVAWLRQVSVLVDELDDEIFATTPQGLAPHRVGSHLRHVLEFYECFLDGFESRRVDYDSRKRNEAIERNRHSALAGIRSIISRLQSIPTKWTQDVLAVRVEDGEADVWLASSIGRELQALSSHTIHHFALIAVTLRAHGVQMDADFGMAPSTLRHLAAKTAEAA